MFRLPGDAPLGAFLRVTLHGKVQQQLEDLQHYVALRYVAAHGRPLGSHDVAGGRASAVVVLLL